MDEINQLLGKIFEEDSLVYAVLSKVKRGEEKIYNKVDIKPVIMKEEKMYHLTYHYDTKDTHENVKKEDFIVKVSDLMDYFRQAVIYTLSSDYQILISKKGKVKIISKPPTRSHVDFNHNRKKEYILPEDSYNEFLFKLGIMQSNGKIKKEKYDKFRQLNKYLEFVRDSLVYLDKSKAIKIIDFGCGKAYLTFALYYYLVEVEGYAVNIIGLDLKENVIEFCNDLSKELGFDDLKFMLGDIKDFTSEDDIDMVVSLHACDTATDEAISKAIKWNAKVIFAVPCCQHELFDKIENNKLDGMIKYGIIKEKLSSLITDSFRANALEVMGYQTQVLEFIDLEHTPKNILIRAYKRGTIGQEGKRDFNQMKEVWNVTPYIEHSLGLEFKRMISE